MGGRGQLPERGGLLDQKAPLVRAFKYLDAIHAQYRKALKGKQDG